MQHHVNFMPHRLRRSFLFSICFLRNHVKSKHTHGKRQEPHNSVWWGDDDEMIWTSSHTFSQPANPSTRIWLAQVTAIFSAGGQDSFRCSVTESGSMTVVHSDRHRSMLTLWQSTLKERSYQHTHSHILWSPKLEYDRKFIGKHLGMLLGTKDQTKPIFGVLKPCSESSTRQRLYEMWCCMVQAFAKLPNANFVSVATRIHHTGNIYSESCREALLGKDWLQTSNSDKVALCNRPLSNPFASAPKSQMHSNSCPSSRQPKCDTSDPARSRHRPHSFPKRPR